MSWSTLALALLLELGSGIAPINRGTIDRGRILYIASCSRCHGSTAIGDGADAALLVKRPIDLRRSGVLEEYENKPIVERVREGKNARLQFRPETEARLAANSEALYRFLIELPGVDWKAVDAGEETYLDRCTPCHGLYGRPDAAPPAGVKRSPRDLSNPDYQSEISDRELEERVRHGKDGMPALVPQLTKPAAKDLVKYVRRLGPGFELYDRFCATCHGPHGEGATGALQTTAAPHFAFDAALFREHGPDHVRISIWHMLEDKVPAMPHFEESLTEREVNAIVTFLKSLPPLPKETYGADPD